MLDTPHFAELKKRERVLAPHELARTLGKTQRFCVFSVNLAEVRSFRETWKSCE
jgi:hypothetical protein